MSPQQNRKLSSPLSDAAITFVISYLIANLCADGIGYLAGIQDSVVLSLAAMTGAGLVTYVRFSAVSGHEPTLLDILKLSVWSAVMNILFALVWVSGYGWLSGLDPWSDLLAQLGSGGDAALMLAIIVPITLAIFVAMYGLIYGVIARLLYNACLRD